MSVIYETFDFEPVQRSVRMVGTPDDPWFCGKDVAVILGYKNTTGSIRAHVDSEDKTQLRNITTTARNGRLLNKNELRMIYINESGLYSLIMRSKLSGAKRFKRWVTSEVLPSLRKTEQYAIDARVRELESQVKQRDEVINRTNKINKELLQYKLRITKDQTVYVMSTKALALQGMFKIGRTRQHIMKRLKSANTSHPTGDEMHVLKTIKTHDAVALERRCHAILRPLRPNPKKEWFCGHWNNISALLDLVGNNRDEELDAVNKLVKTLCDANNKDNDAYTDGLDMALFDPPEHKEEFKIVHSSRGVQRERTIDVAGLSTAQKKEKLTLAINQFVRDNIADLPEFDLGTYKEDNGIVLKWPFILNNLMSIMGIKRQKIKASVWRQTLKTMMNEFSCIKKVKWNK